MQQAIVTISGAEITKELLETIQKILKGKKNREVEVFIRVKDKETTEEAKKRIDRSIENIEKGENLVSFSATEYDSLKKKLSEK